jgi:hypothetical protein
MRLLQRLGVILLLTHSLAFAQSDVIAQEVTPEVIFAPGTVDLE